MKKNNEESTPDSPGGGGSWDKARGPRLLPVWSVHGYYLWTFFLLPLIPALEHCGVDSLPELQDSPLLKGK